jgi:hypothetical protein
MPKKPGTEMKYSKRIVWLCIGAWGCLLALTIYESLLLPDRLVLEGIDVSPEMSQRQVWIYVWIASGLAIAIFGMRSGRWWIATIVVSALIFLVGWYLKGPMARVGPLDGYRLIWNSATQLGRFGPYLVRDLIVPLLHLLALVLALFGWRWESKS